MSANPLIVIGLDAADPILVERWMDRGHLPALAALRNSGTYTRLENFDYCRAEAACTSFLTGCAAWQTGRWGAFRFDEKDYSVEDLQAYEFDEYPPFYAVDRTRRVAVFDLPQTRLVEGQNGIQVLGWGAHSPRTPRVSIPGGLLADLTARHGEHPTYERDHCTLWDTRAMRALKEGLEIGVARRANICRELLQDQDWDLFITYFGETHSAGHFFWHLSQEDHPLPRAAGQNGDWLLEIFQAVDRAVGDIVAASPQNARFMLVSDHGMEANSTDLPSLVFLPELLYRWSFPGRFGLDTGRTEVPPPPPVVPRAGRSWTDEVWARKHDRNPITRALRRRLPVEFFHYAIERRLGLHGVPLCPEDCALGYEPPMWYHPAWPRMRAFALPSFSEGYIRLNVRGRERDGIVDPADYERVCDEIEALLRQVRNARTGTPMVQKIMRSRMLKEISDTKLPDPDLLVLWTAEPADVVDTPLGRIGPMPFQRTGSHVERGFLLASGPGIPVGYVPRRMPHALDLPPTILALMGISAPAYMDGKPLFGQGHETADAGDAESPLRSPMSAGSRLTSVGTATHRASTR
jgi:predicted AlkP superfamily phosphohydrolase/phosphomutase